MSLAIFTRGPEDAPTIVFLHGLGVSSWMWTPQVEALAGEYRCLSIDLPGCGESYAVPWHSMADSARQVANIIRAEVPSGKAHVVGLSMGGFVALHLLQAHPAVVESVLVSGVSTRPLPWTMRLLMQVVSHLMHWKPFIHMNARLMQIPPDSLPLLEADMQHLSRQTLVRVYDEILPFDLVRLFARPLERRLLAVAGDQEVASIVHGLQDYAALLPQGRVRAALVPGAHHGWNGEFPDLFTDMIRAWVNDRPLPDALHAVQTQILDKDRNSVLGSQT